jgi:hypothetical protein
MELSTSQEATSCTVTQELLSILWKPKVHYRAHKSSIQSQNNPAIPPPSYVSQLRDLSPQANYTNRATAVYIRS